MAKKHRSWKRCHRGATAAMLRRCGFSWFGTPLVQWRANPIKIHPIMKPNIERARKLEATATRMMIAGNVERYLHALRLLFTLRNRNTALVA